MLFFSVPPSHDAEAAGGTVGYGKVRMTGSSRSIQGTYPSLLVTGSIAASGTTTGSVTLTDGKLTPTDRVLTIKIP